MGVWGTSEANALTVWTITNWKENNVLLKDVFNTKAILANFVAISMIKWEMDALLKIALTGLTINVWFARMDIIWKTGFVKKKIPKWLFVNDGRADDKFKP